MMPTDTKPLRLQADFEVGELAAARRPGFSRYIFVALAALFPIVTFVGFAPSYSEHFTGTYRIHPIAHVHGALMTAWLILFIAQASLAASGAVNLHRKLGLTSLVLAPLMWVSMLVTTWRPLVAEALPVDHFLFDVVLVQLLMILLFPLFVTWGILARRRPGTHKRLMIFATVVLLQAAIDRMHFGMRWLPDIGLPTHWGADVYVYVLLLPLFAFDFLSMRRIHRVTLICAAALLGGHVVVNGLFGSPAWHRFAFDLTNAMR